jgi:hypothetical protein
MKRIRALNELEFAAASSGESIYGKYKGMYAYIELGIEEEYREHPKDEPKTTYRLFRNCNVEYSETEEQSEQGVYQYKDVGVSIIVYW